MIDDLLKALEESSIDANILAQQVKEEQAAYGYTDGLRKQYEEWLISNPAHLTLLQDCIAGILSEVLQEHIRRYVVICSTMPPELEKIAIINLQAKLHCTASRLDFKVKEWKAEASRILKEAPQ